MLGIIGGSGLYDLGMDGFVAREVSTPYGNPSSPVMICREKNVAFLARHGFGHVISAPCVDHRANIWALKSVGVTELVSFSAVGSLSGDVAPGDVVFPRQFFNRSANACYLPTFFESNGCVVHVGFAEPTCPNLVQFLGHVATHEGVPFAPMWDCTYVQIEGPQFSTRAESQINKVICESIRTTGVVGMTAMTEAKLAREAELCYALYAMVTDYDAWNAEAGYVTADEVTKVMAANSEKAKKVILGLIENYEPQDCECQKALDNAISTDKRNMTFNPRSQSLLLKRYLGLNFTCGV